MPVIINMEMPKGCEIADHTLKNGVRDCPLSPICTARKKEILKHGTLGDHIIDYYPPNCPIVGEIPDKHGDLCDKDKLKEATKDTEIHNSRGEIYPIGKAIAKMIDEAPTVLEASK